MASVPHLFDHSPTQAAAPPRSQDVLKSRGYLRVLAYYGSEVKDEHFEAAAADGGGPLAFFRMENLSELYGSELLTIMQSKLE
jgi:hypothetical protein